MSLPITETLLILSLALFSLADLRYRLAPAIEVFFLGCILIASPIRPLQVLVVILGVIWSLFWKLPGFLALPLLFHPPAWPVLLAGFGTRMGVVGRADLLALAGLACLLPWPALVLALLGLEAWRLFWRKRQGGPVPALPGLLLGVLPYWLVGWLTRGA